MAKDMRRESRVRKGFVEIRHSDVEQTAWVKPESLATYERNGWTRVENGDSKTDPVQKPAPEKRSEPRAVSVVTDDKKE